MCEAYITPTVLKFDIADNQRYYNCRYFYVEDIKRSLEHIVQLRIEGELEYYAYVKNDSFLLSSLEEHFEMLDDLKEDIEQKISVIKRCADALNINLSSQIKYIIEV